MNEDLRWDKGKKRATMESNEEQRTCKLSLAFSIKNLSMRKQWHQRQWVFSETAELVTFFVSEIASVLDL
jgi:hypothetical protein